MSETPLFCTEKTETPGYGPRFVVGMGEVLWDMLPEGRQIGGAPTNFAFHAAQFGLESLVVSAVGNDTPGREIHEFFASRHLRGIIEDVPFPTGTVQVTVSGQGVPAYEIREGVAWDNIPFTPALKTLALQTRAVCWGTLAQRSAVSRATINRFLDTMPDGAGRLKVFDINLRQNFYTETVIRDSLKRCNILKINDEELVAVTRLFGYPDSGLEDSCRRLLGEYALRSLILTCGARGSYIFTPGGTSFVNTPRVTVADTVGAGDSFTGSFVAGLLQGLGIRESHERAVRTSAFVCTRHGAMPQLPESCKQRP